MSEAPATIGDAAVPALAPFQMVGGPDALVCEDGVCTVPTAAPPEQRPDQNA